MTDITNCPTTEQLRALLDQSMIESEQADLQRHVDTCESCQQRLEALVAGTESWDEAVGHLRNKSDSPSEPGLAEAVRRIKSDEPSNSGSSDAPGPLDFLEPSDHPGSLGRLGAYEVTEIVGKGGMGVVLKAYDSSLHRVVAVKILAPYLANNPLARKRFVREAQAIAAVSHDHVITIHAIDESAEQPKIVMQFVAGRSLQEKLDAEGSLDVKEVLRIGMQTASGLAAAHAQGLVHRDVKPSNILLENGIQRVRLTDFGLARAVDDASLTQSGVIAGTPQYMAPEQANGDAVDHRADLFSLGSVMYAMCVGHSPFRASTTMGVLKRVCHDPPRPIQELNPDIPDWLCAIIMKLLAKTPADRFQSARQVAELLEKWLAHVQQPNVVPRPASTGQATAQHATASHPAPAAQQAPSYDYSQTIFFQPISGRMFLFFLLGGIAGSMAFGVSQRVPMGELVLVSVFGGLTFAFWMLLFSALIRFLWANIAPVVHWARGTKPAPPEDKPLRKPPTRGLPPESIAMLAAIGSLLVGAPILVAAIVAIIVWRIATSWKATPASSRKEETVVSDTPAPDGSAATVVDVKSWSNGPARLLQRIGTSLGGLIELEPALRNRLLLAIAWCLSGAVDVAVSLDLLDHLREMPEFLIFVLAIGFGLLSFATASCIYVRQNFDQVRGASFLGLLPFSPGAVLRIPVSVVTLFWLHHADVRDAFSPLPWHESHLGRLLRGQHEKLQPLVRVMAWIVGWSAICLVGLVVYFFAYVIPYGPSLYQVQDSSIQVMSSKNQDLSFGLRGSGFGSGRGLRPSRFNFSLVHLTLISSKLGRRIELGLTTPVTITTSGQHRELTAGDLEAWFQESSGSPHPKEAASLFKTIQALRANQLAVRPVDPLSLSASDEYQDRTRTAFDVSSADLPAYVDYADLASLVDPSVFDVTRQSGRGVRYSLNPADWFMVPMIGLSLVIWLMGVWWITRKKHTARGAAGPAQIEIGTAAL